MKLSRVEIITGISINILNKSDPQYRRASPERSLYELSPFRPVLQRRKRQKSRGRNTGQCDEKTVQDKTGIPDLIKIRSAQIGNQQNRKSHPEIEFVQRLHKTAV